MAPEAHADELVAVAGAATVTIPEDPSDPIALSAGLGPVTTIDLPESSTQRDAAVADDGTVVYGDADRTTDFAVQATAQGVRVSSVLVDSGAPTSYDYMLSIPAGGELRAVDGGGAAIADADGNVVTTIDPAWARDANGVAVPTHYEVNGSTLTQVVDHANGDYAYPIVADPFVRHWYGYSLTLSDSATGKIVKALNAGAGAAGVALDLCNWNDRGVTIHITWTGQFWCWPR